MKTIKENGNMTTIILEDDDELEIVSLKRNKGKLVIKCINSILHIEEINKNDFFDEEQKSIEAMKKYLKDDNK